MRIIALISLCLTASLNSFALTLDDNLAGEWRIEYLDGSKEPMTITLISTAKTAADFSVDQYLGNAPVYDLKSHVIANDDGEKERFASVFGFSIARNWKGQDYVVWLLRSPDESVDLESNIILGINGEALILGSDLGADPLAKMIRVAKDEL